MNLEFDWQVGDEQDQQEVLAHIGRRPRRLVPRWVWLVVAAIVLSIGTGGYFVLRQRYDEAKARIAFQIQAAIDLEVAAYARGDAALFLEQQDRAVPEWYASQATRVGEDCLEAARTGSRVPGPSGRAIDRYPCEPVLPATVQEVELRRDIAWVEVVEDLPPMRRVRFYKQTDLGWVQTAPQVEFWGTAVEVRYGGDLVFRYHRRDRPHVQPTVDRIVEALDQACSTFSCALEKPIEFNFVIDMPRLKPPELRDSEILLPSPWVAGIPVGEDDASHVADYAYLVAYKLAAAHLRAAAGRPLTRFEEAMAGEYAAWQSTGLGHAPIVDRLVERRGADALPAVFASLQDVSSLNLLMVEWLGLSASTRPSAYFEALVNLEQQALAAGRKETFLLLQDETVPGWLAAQESFFDRSRAQHLGIEPAKVQSVDLSGELARVTLDRPTALADAHSLAPRDQIVYFRRQDGDWKHTSPRFTRIELPHIEPPTALVAESEASPAHARPADARDALALHSHAISVSRMNAAHQ